MSQRIAPSRQIKQQLSAFLQEGLTSSEEPLSQFIRLAVRAIWNTPNRDTADLLVHDFITRYGATLPSATACLQDDLEACLSFLRCPPLHHKRIRTTNLIERAFAEQRRRTKTIPRFWDEKSCLKLVFATLMQTSERWQNVHMSDIGVAMLMQLRRELGLEPPAPRHEGQSVGQRQVA